MGGPVAAGVRAPRLAAPEDMSCRVALLRMHRDGPSSCPPPQQLFANRGLRRRRTPQAPLTGSVHEVAELCARPVAKGSEATLWREYVDPLSLRLYPAAGRPTAASGVQRVAGGGGPGLLRRRLEGGSPRPVHRVECSLPGSYCQGHGQ